MASEEDPKKQPSKDAADDDDSDDDFGPAPLPSGGAGEEAIQPAKKKRRRLAHEEVYVANLPCSDMYEKSYMHRDWVTHCVFTLNTDFLVTASQDGHVKFWKKMPEGLEFVKHYHAHLGEVLMVQSRCCRVNVY